MDAPLAELFGILQFPRNIKFDQSNYLFSFFSIGYENKNIWQYVLLTVSFYAFQFYAIYYFNSHTYIAKNAK